ncbi:hypothetical protein DPEC_G00200330 [Dallia pectoralis]|uniref:Uncharacterized protein n=1 Tax=Dallia pectoralis TaxID=75939 RepID=A0ACC2G8Z4_DALPE|nr:hypothetical protein DPEC_G00200330 [Dallia pectoralis]
MSDSVVYADVRFTRTERKDTAGDVDCQAEVGVKPQRSNPVIAVLVVLCVLLMGAVIGLLIGITQPNCTVGITQPNCTVGITQPNCTENGGRNCSSGWKNHGSNCYFFSNDEMTWNQSWFDCVYKGGQLVIIESPEEQTFLEKEVQDTLNTSHDANRFWIGLRVWSLQDDGKGCKCKLFKKLNNVTCFKHPARRICKARQFTFN